MTRMMEIHCFVIDDEQDAVERLVILLSKFAEIKIAGMETVPEKAIEGIALKKPDLVFTDVEMPRISGFEVVNRVRENNLDPGFIFVTAFDQYAIKAIKAQAFDFLIKPVDIDDLKDSIDRFKQQLLDGKRSPFHKAEGLPNFTDRELEIIQLIAQCKTAKQIADVLRLSKNTIDTHRKNILKKADLHKTSELIVYAKENGLDTPAG